MYKTLVDSSFLSTLEKCTTSFGPSEFLMTDLPRNQIVSPIKKGTFSHSLLPRYFVFPFQKSNYNWSWRKVLLACLWFAQLLGSAACAFCQIWEVFSHSFFKAFFQPCLHFPLLPGLQWHQCQTFCYSPMGPGIFTPTVLLLFKLGKLYCSIVRFRYTLSLPFWC